MKEPQGSRLNAVAPVYEFTNHEEDFAYSSGAVFLTEYDGSPHWFATDGYSAMLTPALLAEASDALFPLEISEYRVYNPIHIKALFRHVKHGSVIYDPETGTLTSPDGIMIVPPYVMEADEGEEAEKVPLPDIDKVFEGEEEAQSSFEFGWSFVSSVRAAFKAGSREAQLSMYCLEGSRVLLEVSEPYEGRVLIALSRQKEKPERKSAVDDLKKSMQNIADKSGVDITFEMGDQSATFQNQNPS